MLTKLHAFSGTGSMLHGEEGELQLEFVETKNIRRFSGLVLEEDAL